LIKSTNCKYDPVAGKVVTVYTHNFTGKVPFVGDETEWNTLKAEGRIFELNEATGELNETEDVSFNEEDSYYV